MAPRKKRLRELGLLPPAQAGEGGRIAAPGNEFAVSHGAYVSALRLGEEVAHRADYYRDLLIANSLYAEAFEPILADLGLVDVRIERGAQALLRADEATAEPLSGYVGPAGETLDRLRQDVRAWLRHKRSLLGDLGLSPQAMAKMGLRVAQAESMVVALQRAQEREQ